MPSGCLLGLQLLDLIVKPVKVVILSLPTCGKLEELRQQQQAN